MPMIWFYKPLGLFWTAERVLNSDEWGLLIWIVISTQHWSDLVHESDPLKSRTCKWQAAGILLRISSDTCVAKISELDAVCIFVFHNTLLSTPKSFFFLPPPPTQVLWLLSFDDKNTLADAVDKYCIGVPPIQWLAWIPQLLTCLVGSEGKPLLNLISQVCTSIILLLITVLMWPRVYLYCLLGRHGQELGVVACHVQ